MYSIASANIIFDYDQVEDLFLTKRIVVDRDFPIIGRPIYGDPNFHHGVAFFYYNLIPFIIFKWNPLFIAYWNSFFNAGLAVILYFFGKALFGKKLPAFIAAIIAAVSYEIVTFSGWLTSTTPTMFTVPLFFLGLWLYFQRKNWGLPLAAFFLGLSINLEIFFLYLIPTAVLLWVMFKPRFPQIKTLLISVGAFVLTTSTLIATEFILKFAGVKTLLNFGQTFDDSEILFMDRINLFIDDFSLKFSLNLFPLEQKLGIYLGIVIIILALLHYKKSVIFVLVYLFSPLFMLLLGYHKQPWFLIGVPPALALLSGHSISKLKPKFLIIPAIFIVGWSNLAAIKADSKTGPAIFAPEKSIILSSQLAVVDYTYRESKGEPFALNTVTYPLYHNAYWEYHYKWYGEKKYGYLPGFLGNEQIYPYEVLPRADDSQKTMYLIIDTTYRIPEVHRDSARAWAEENGSLIEEKRIEGFIVQKISR